MSQSLATPDNTPRILVKFYWDCGRMGSVEGLFVTTREQLQAATGKNVYFGEILGKHSEVYGVLDGEGADCTVVTDDAEFIEKLVQYVGVSVSGYNPLSYLGEAEE